MAIVQETNEKVHAWWYEKDLNRDCGVAAFVPKYELLEVTECGKCIKQRHDSKANLFDDSN